MIIIGEKLNSSIPATLAAFQAQDEGFVREMAQKQADNGAAFLDINASMLPDEKEKLVWAAENAIAACDAGLMLDSPDPAVIEYALAHISGRPLIVNSVTLEQHRLDGMLPLLRSSGAGVVALPIGEDGMPKTADKRVQNAEKLIDILTGAGVKPGDIYIDIIVEAVSADWEAPRRALEAAARLRAGYPEIHLVAGVSNVSFGLPKRAFVNSAFLCSAAAMGLDAAIMDITNPSMRMQLAAAEMVNGRDEYCMEYLTAYRELFD